MKQTLMGKRIAKGIKFLNTVVPDWEQKIDLNRLRLESTNDCIFGQVFGAGALYGFTFTGKLLSDYGFDIRLTDTKPRTSMQIYNKYFKLTEAWKKVILKRRKK